MGMTAEQLDENRQLNWLLECLQRARLPLEDEKRLQLELASRLESYGIPFEREVPLFEPGERSDRGAKPTAVVFRRGTSMGKTTDLPEWLKPAGIIDFYVPNLRVGIEVKIKGKAADVVRQLRRYAEDPRFQQLIVLTGKSFVLPETIGKRRVVVDVVNISRGWL